MPSPLLPRSGFPICNNKASLPSTRWKNRSVSWHATPRGGHNFPLLSMSTTTINSPRNDNTTSPVVKLNSLAPTPCQSPHPTVLRPTVLCPCYNTPLETNSRTTVATHSLHNVMVACWTWLLSRRSGTGVASQMMRIRGYLEIATAPRW